MHVRVVTLEREYGSGGAIIAQRLATHLGWKLWDREITTEIARRANVDQRTAARCDERVDSLLYRLFKVYARGSYERALPISESRHFDTDRMVAMMEQVVGEFADRGNCVIVGRGAPYFLRHRLDAFHVFVYAPVEEKVRRLGSIGQSEKEALRLIEEVDRERAQFIRHYFGKEWPYRPLYNLMINSKFGDEHVVETVLEQLTALENRPVTVNAATAI
jgi:cytidylate kinase